MAASRATETPWETVENINAGFARERREKPEREPALGTAAERRHPRRACRSGARVDARAPRLRCPTSFRTAMFLSATVKAVRDRTQGYDASSSSMTRNRVWRQRSRGARATHRATQRILEETNREASLDRDILVADHDEFIAMLVTSRARAQGTSRAAHLSLRRLFELGVGFTPPFFSPPWAAVARRRRLREAAVRHRGPARLPRPGT